MSKTVLKNISEIRRFFHRNEDPVYFISATNFNLLGLDEWVKNFKYICYIYCYGGKYPKGKEFLERLEAIDLRLTLTDARRPGAGIAGTGRIVMAQDAATLTLGLAMQLAGAELGGVPLATAVALQTGLPFVIVRKEAKGHGTGAWLEGPLPEAGSRITVLEDVVTTGGSSLKAVISTIWPLCLPSS